MLIEDLSYVDLVMGCREVKYIESKLGFSICKGLLDLGELGKVYELKSLFDNLDKVRVRETHS